VVRIITPSTLNLEGENYTNDEATSYIVSICGENWIYGISFLESSSWKWKTWVLENREKLSWEIYKIAPKEVILEKKLFNDESLKEILEKKYSLNIYYFDTDKKYKEKLLSHFWVKNLEGFWIENKPLAIKSSILLLEYLKTNQQSSLEHLNSISSESFSNFLELDESTIRNLDLIYNIATKSSTIWTLFWVLDNTKTPMWKRFLKEAIVNPLRDKEKIQNRLDITDEFLNNQQLLNSIREKLKYVVDLDNILTRLALWRANPKDLLNLKKSLETILEVIDLIKKEGSANLNNLLHL
jgi:DNA mismatch repair protein MutS